MTMSMARLFRGGATAVALCQRCKRPNNGTGAPGNTPIGDFFFVRTGGGWRVVGILTLQHVIGLHIDTN